MDSIRQLVAKMQNANISTATVPTTEVRDQSIQTCPRFSFPRFYHWISILTEYATVLKQNWALISKSLITFKLYLTDSLTWVTFRWRILLSINEFDNIQLQQHFLQMINVSSGSTCRNSTDWSGRTRYFSWNSTYAHVIITVCNLNKHADTLWTDQPKIIDITHTAVPVLLHVLSGYAEQKNCSSEHS